MFTAVWCETYLKDIEPKTLEACRRAREQADELSQNASVEWVGVVTNLWTTPKALASYQAQMKPRVAMFVDTEGRAFRTFGIGRLPAVALIDAEGRLVAENVNYFATIVASCVTFDGGHSQTRTCSPVPTLRLALAGLLPFVLSRSP